MDKKYFYVIHDTPPGHVTMGLADEVQEGVCEITGYTQMSETMTKVLLGPNSGGGIKDYHRIWKGNHLKVSVIPVEITNKTKIDYVEFNSLEKGVIAH